MRRNLNMMMAMASLIIAEPTTTSSRSIGGSSRGSSLSKRRWQATSLEYPEHYTNQQRGFTPVGSARLHFYHSNNSNAPYQIGRMKKFRVAIISPITF